MVVTFVQSNKRVSSLFCSEIKFPTETPSLLIGYIYEESFPRFLYPFDVGYPVYTSR